MNLQLLKLLNCHFKKGCLPYRGSEREEVQERKQGSLRGTPEEILLLQTKLFFPGIMDYGCNPSTRETEVGTLSIQVQY